MASPLNSTGAQPSLGPLGPTRFRRALEARDARTSAAWPRTLCTNKFLPCRPLSPKTASVARPQAGTQRYPPPVVGANVEPLPPFHRDPPAPVGLCPPDGDFLANLPRSHPRNVRHSRDGRAGKRVQPHRLLSGLPAVLAGLARVVKGQPFRPGVNRVVLSARRVRLSPSQARRSGRPRTPLLRNRLATPSAPFESPLPPAGPGPRTLWR